MNEIELHRDAPVFGDLATQMDAINQLGEHIARSGFAGCEKVEQGVIIAFTCLAEKITPLEFTRTYDIIQGRPTKKAAVMLADDGEDGKKATLKLIHKGKEKSPVSFHYEEAQKKGLTSKTNWKIHLPEMLRARCITKALRMHVPEIAAGIYSPDEIGDDEITSVRDSVQEREHHDRKPLLDEEVPWDTQFAMLVNDRPDDEISAIQSFVSRKFPNGMPMDKMIKAVKHFDTFLSVVMEEAENNGTS
jgi:hypothetical protein